MGASAGGMEAAHSPRRAQPRGRSSAGKEPSEEPGRVELRCYRAMMIGSGPDETQTPAVWTRLQKYQLYGNQCYPRGGVGGCYKMKATTTAQNIRSDADGVIT